MEEKLYSVSAFSTASEKLYVLYSYSDLVGEEKRPSMLVSEVKDILGIEEEQIHDIPLEFFCTSERTAYYKYLEHSNDKTVQSESVKKFLESDPVYKNRLDALYSINEDGKFKLDSKISDRLFFNEDVTEVSPTKLEMYFSCPFKFFCNYGLKLKKVFPVNSNGAFNGNALHFLLEKIMKKESNDSSKEMFDKKFLDLSDDEIKVRIKKEFDIYYKEMLGGDFGKTPTFHFMYDKLIDTAFYIVKYVKSELCQSQFEPVAMEYKINHDENDEKYTIDLGNGKKIVLIGKVDRIDIFTNSDGKKYVRIIDYKTKRDMVFNLSKFYNGLDLQMFVYLSTLLETKNIVDPDKLLNQAGVIYLAIGNSAKLTDENTADEKEVMEKAEKEKIGAFKSSGGIVDLPEVTNAFGNKTNKGELFDNEKFTLLRKFALNKVKEFGTDLLDGDISARPVSECDSSYCTYCDYKGICGNSFPDDAVNVVDKNFKKMIEEELNKIKEEEAKDE